MRRLFLVAVMLAACNIPQEHFFSGDGGGGDDDDGGMSEPVTVEFAAAASTQDESSGDVNVVVRLSAPADDPVVVNYAFDGGTASAGLDYRGSNGQLTFAPGDTEETIAYQILPDGEEEGDETIQITLSGPTPNAMLGTATHTVTISAAMLPRANIMTETDSATEGQSATITVVLDAPAPVESTVTLALKPAGTSASSTFDFTTPSNLTLTFPAGSMMQTLTVPVIVDAIDEDDEAFIFELTTTTNLVIGSRKTYTFTIQDDDGPPVVAISANANGIEGNSGTTQVTITVTITPSSGKMVTVPITYGGGTATEGADFSYSAKPATLTFFPSQNPALSETSKTITLVINSDANDEDDQTVVTSLVNAPTNATLTGSPRTVNTYTIADDDGPPLIKFITPSGSFPEMDSGTHTASYQLGLSVTSEKPISYDITIGGTAIIPGDLTTSPPGSGAGFRTVRMNIPPGMMTSQIDLIIQGDDVQEGLDETTTMTISSSNLSNVVRDTVDQTRTHTIVDDD